MNDANVNEILRLAWEISKEEMDSKDNDDYEVDEIQMQKLMNAYSFFLEIAGREGGRVEPLSLVPKEQHCGITAYFILFDLYGEDLKRFLEIVGDMSCVSIDTTLDNEVCISFNIPNVYRKKKAAKILKLDPSYKKAFSRF